MTITYALLKDRAKAESAIAELESMARNNRQLKVHVLSHGAHTDTIRLHETSAIKGLTNGLLAGSLGAGTLVLLMSVTGLFGGATLPAVLAAIGLGTFYGGFVGFLAGTAGPDLNLQRLEREADDDDVLVSISCNDLQEFSAANQVLRRHGAIEAHPRLI